MYVATVVGAGASAALQTQFEAIDGVTVTEVTTLASDLAVDFALSVDASTSIDSVRSAIRSLEDSIEGNICFQLTSQRHRKLVIFDMDSTLIQQEVIDLVAAYANVQDEVSRITELAMQGQLDFSQSFRSRVALLKGIPDTVFESLKPQIQFTPGARQLCAGLKANGVKMAVASGGFKPLADWVKDQLGLDYALANTIESRDGVLTGQVVGSIVDAEAKAAFLTDIAATQGIDLQLAMAVGDGSNDLRMMSVAGNGVAFCAKPKVRMEAQTRLDTPDLSLILYFMGYH